MKNIFTLAVFLIACASYSQSNLNAALPLDPKIRTGTLPNGMKYFIQKNSKPEKRAELRLAQHRRRHWADHGRRDDGSAEDLSTDPT